jgi:hypothetical protein
MTPSFTRGTQTSRTESTTTVAETYEIVEYSTGTSYTMSGTNIQWSGQPGPNANYTQIIPGGATQFSETLLGPGISTETNFTRTTTIESVTNSISVFTQ